MEPMWELMDDYEAWARSIGGIIDYDDGDDDDDDDASCGKTPFLQAAAEGHCDIIMRLLDHPGVDINQVTDDHRGSTAVLLAVEGGHVEAIKILLKHGADVKKANNYGETPVHRALRAQPTTIAQKLGVADAVHMLLKAGADARAADTPLGNTALHDAAGCGHLPVVQVLAEIWPTNPLAWRMFLMGGGAPSELEDYISPPTNRETRNYLLRLYGKLDVIKEIWKYLHKPRYADLDQTNNAGQTASQVADAVWYASHASQVAGAETWVKKVASLLRELKQSTQDGGAAQSTHE